MNIFEEGLAALQDTLANDVEVYVRYRRDNTEYVVPATRGSINWSTLNKLGDIALGENFRDYIIRADQLPIIPANNDLIIDGAETFEVFNPDSSSKCYRWSDPYKRLFRIYTRRIKQ